MSAARTVLRFWFGLKAFVTLPIYGLAIALSLVATPLALVRYAAAPAFYAFTYVGGRIPLPED